MNTKKRLETLEDKINKVIKHLGIEDDESKDYLEAIESCSDHFTRGRIYKGLIIKSIFEVEKNDSGIKGDYNIDCFKPSTKKAYEAQQNKPKYENGKWYVSKIDDLLYIFQYSTSSKGEHFPLQRVNFYEEEKRYVVEKTSFKSNSKTDKASRPATKKEITKALTAIAEDKGFKLGVIVDRSPLMLPELVVTKCYLGKSSYTHYDTVLDRFYYKGILIYAKGKWAKIIEESNKIEFLGHEAIFNKDRSIVDFGCQVFTFNEVKFIKQLYESSVASYKLTVNNTEVPKELIDKLYNKMKKRNFFIF